ncbi:chemotaxis protein CheA [Pelagicoccus mobilis]|uniref:Chemotaxis protein CheA n=1 Tax=Pelagicoccus mobilis TaxID=415221 RepID=A0A934S1P8_9BACT|nr:chemotaxis protein CheA [Pelagicoccus mobilis]MBK1877473.1 chemotaxis protein CheA [Pelagicoccus mobilis]
MSQTKPTDVFLLEAEDLLSVIEQGALDIAQDMTDSDCINRLFRAFHTIKGSGAMFGFDEVAAFTHNVETVLDEVRSGKISFTPTLIELILASKDHIKNILAEDADKKTGETLTSELALILGTTQTQPSPSQEAKETPAQKESGPKSYQIYFKPSPDIAAHGLEPASLLDELRDLGACRIAIDLDELPKLDELQAESCHLAWNIELETEQGIDAIKDVFIFVEDESTIRIVQSDTPQSSAANQNNDSAEAAPKQPAKASPKKSGVPQSNVRVPSEKLDRLVNLVGELVMNQSRLSQISTSIDSTELDTPVEEIERLVSELRDSVLGIRMMPIGSTFGRFRRLVFDLSSELGKEVELITEGEETELDKTVLDQLGDPLVHLIRNSLDHGIESPETRAAQGKSPRGTLRMSASHEGSQVVVKIEDDGQGMDPNKILEKAIEKGVVPPDANLSEREIFNLIFHAGFSTAQQVTNVSGRGVGMDVVKRQLESLRGSIQISSKQGAGTTVSLTLPLTLAIIDGQLVEIGGDRYIMPMSAITENVEITADERTTQNGRNLITVRGDLVPYIRLRELFEYTDAAPPIEKVVIVKHNGERIGFVVDRVLGSHQTVIQSLGKFYKEIRVVSGSTIMGDGKVALILDVAGLIADDANRFKLAATV